MNTPRVSFVLAALLLLLDSSAGWAMVGSACRGHAPALSRPFLQRRTWQSQSSSISQEGITPTATQREKEVVSTRELDATQRDFILGYLNKHHTDLLISLAEAFSSLGSEMAVANVWSGGSFAIASATIVNIDSLNLTLNVTVQIRGKPAEERSVQFPLTADPVPERERSYDKAVSVPEADEECVNGRLPIDDIVRKLCRLCWIVNKPEVSGKLIQLAFQLNGAGVGQLPENMYVCATEVCSGGTIDFLCFAYVTN